MFTTFHKLRRHLISFYQHICQRGRNKKIFMKPQPARQSVEASSFGEQRMTFALFCEINYHPPQWVFWQMIVVCHAN